MTKGNVYNSTWCSRKEIEPRVCLISLLNIIYSRRIAQHENSCIFIPRFFLIFWSVIISFSSIIYAWVLEVLTTLEAAGNLKMEMCSSRNGKIYSKYGEATISKLITWENSLNMPIEKCRIVTKVMSTHTSTLHKKNWKSGFYSKK